MNDVHSFRGSVKRMNGTYDLVRDRIEYYDITE